MNQITIRILLIVSQIKIRIQVNQQMKLRIIQAELCKKMQMKESNMKLKKLQIYQIIWQYNQKCQVTDETIKSLQQQNEFYRKLITSFENERQSNKDTIRLLQKQDTDNIQKLLQKEWYINKMIEECKIIQEREKFSDSINVKFMKKAEKSKSKLKQLKLQLISESKDTQSDLWSSMQMIVDSQQCKKRVKQVNFNEVSTYVLQTLYRRRQLKKFQQSLSCLQNQIWNRRSQINQIELININNYIQNMN
ncbi:unnamed protein product [Paramecium primaurelia]|uniref:Uncharacterized protein n=1 Tax=Paramecium primaurelia TaxID=5886 RepID=A0A8S1K4G3_PARPR|nr:unnamed protein product [Paramecium primaurelia]